MSLGPPKPPLRESPLSREKAALELQKLRFDMRHARRTYNLQVINAVLLVATALVIFYFVQRPQVGQLEAARLAAEAQARMNERQHIGSLLISALNLSKDADRRRALEAITILYPQYDFLRAILDAQTAIAQSSTPSSDPAKPCTPAHVISYLERARDEIRAKYEIEKNFGSPRSRPGEGAVAAALLRQAQELDLVIVRVKSGAVC